MAELDFQPDAPTGQELDFQPDSGQLDFQADAQAQPVEMRGSFDMTGGQPLEPGTLRTISAAAARVIPAIAGAVGGSFIAPGLGTAGGGAGGAALGEYLAQQIEGRSAPGQMALAAALGAVPGIPIAKSIGTAGRMAIRALEGAGVAGGGQVGSNLIEGKDWSDNLGQAALVGAPLGLAGGILERALMRPAARAVPQTDAPQPVQQDLFAPGVLEAPQAQRQARIAELELENQKLASDAAFQKAKPGTQREIFETPDVIAPGAEMTGPVKLSEQQIRKVNYLLRSAPQQAVDYVASITNKPTATRSVEVGSKMLGGVTERGKLAQLLGINKSDITLPFQPNQAALFLRKMGQESSNMVAGFGPGGRHLTNMVRSVYDRFETQLSDYLEGPQGVTYLADKLKLSPRERENVSDVMEAIAAPLSPGVRQITQVMKAQREAISKRAIGVFELRNPRTGVIIPWQPGPNYMPHFVDFDAVAKDQARLSKIVQEIQAQESHSRGEAVSIPEAQEIFNQMRRNSRQEYGHLEVARTFEFSDYERDGIKAWSQYVEGSLKRFNEAEVFGKKSEAVVEAVNHIGLTAGDDSAHAAQRYITQVMGKDPVSGIRNVDSNANMVLNTVRSLETGFKLSHAVIANAAQPNQIGLITGYMNMYKGLRELQTEHGKDFSRLAGATIEQAMRDLIEATGPGKFGTAVLKYTGFTKVEQFNRMLAATSGKAFAQDLASKLQGATGRGAETIKRHLRAMNIEPMDVIQRGFKLTQEEELKAARSIISRSQFKVRPQDLPLYWNGPLGKLVTQFSSFGFKAAKMINEEVIQEARQGNVKPLVRFLLVTPFVGEIIADVQSLVKNRDRPEELWKRIAENYAAVGAFGLFYDAFRSTSYGEVGVLRRIAGPSISDVAQLVASTQDPKMAARAALQNIPVAGPALRTTVFPPRQKRKDD